MTLWWSQWRCLLFQFCLFLADQQTTKANAFWQGFNIVLCILGRISSSRGFRENLFYCFWNVYCRRQRIVVQRKLNFYSQKYIIDSIAECLMFVISSPCLQLSLSRKYRLFIIDKTSSTFIDHCNYMYIFPPFDESKACIRSIASSYVSIDTAEASQAQSSVIYWTQLKSYISMETFVTFSKAFNFWYVILHRHFHDPFWTTQNVDQMNGDVCIFRCSFTIL